MTDNSDIVPLFSSGASLKQGAIFTAEKPGAAAKAGRKHGPKSLCDLAKEEGLTQMHVVDDRFANYFALNKGMKEIKCQLCFGLKLLVCDSITDKSEASLKNESNVVIWMNGDGSEDYRALINLYTIAATEGFYYVPRIDWKTLKANWHKDLILSLPFYSSFLAKNALSFASIVPDLPAGPFWVFREVDQRLPFDELLDDAVDRYVAGTPGAEVHRVKSVYYQYRRQAKAHLIWRCILGRTTYDKPNMDHHSSREFSLEAFKDLMAPAAMEDAA